MTRSALAEDFRAVAGLMLQAEHLLPTLLDLLRKVDDPRLTADISRATADMRALIPQLRCGAAQARNRARKLEAPR